MYKTIFTFIIFSAFCYAQEGTFSLVPEGSGVTSAAAINDSEYVAIGFDSNKKGSNDFIIKVNSNGEIIKQVSFDFIVEKGKNEPAVSLAGENKLLFLSNTFVDSEYYLKLVIADFQLNIISSITYLSTKNMSALGIEKLPDGNFLLVAFFREVESYWYGYPVLIKINRDGDIIWNLSLTRPYTMNINPYSFIKISDNSFIFFMLDYYWTISSDGLVFNENPFPGGYFQKIVRFNNGNYAALGMNALDFYFELFSPSFEFLEWQELTGYFYDMISIDDSTLILSKQGGLIKIDETGSKYWEKIIDGNPYKINELENKKILLSGFRNGYTIPSFDTKSWLAVLDSAGDHRFIWLQEPKENALITDTIKFVWSSSYVDKIKISYSLSDNIEYTIIDSIDASAQSYYWSPAVNSLYDCTLKLHSIDNPSIRDKVRINFFRDITPEGSIPDTNYFSGNNILMWLANNGMSSHDPKKRTEQVFIGQEVKMQQFLQYSPMDLFGVAKLMERLESTVQPIGMD